jgi:molybdopterin-containing oxidoreductase family iron-sulfur binding subunit
LRAHVLRKEIGKFPDTKRIVLPMLCMHCGDPACLAVCPTGATIKRDDGIVYVDKDICVGCRACATACPYDARFYVKSNKGYYSEYTPFEEFNAGRHPAGVVDKCDFCLERLQKGEQPVCVQTCITKARTFGDLDELMPLIHSRSGYQLRAECDTDPGVYYLD